MQKKLTMYKENFANYLTPLDKEVTAYILWKDNLLPNLLKVGLQKFIANKYHIAEGWENFCSTLYNILNNHPLIKKIHNSSILVTIENPDIDNEIQNDRYKLENNLQFQSLIEQSISVTTSHYSVPKNNN